MLSLSYYIYYIIFLVNNDEFLKWLGEFLYKRYENIDGY